MLPKMPLAEVMYAGISLNPSGGVVNPAKLAVRVHPNAPRNGLAGFSDGVLQVRIAAPPVEGRANRELVDFLSEALGVSRSAITILRGHTARSKLVAIAGLTEKEVIRRLSPET